MRKVILGTLLLLSSLGFGQEAQMENKFKFGETGINDYVVVNIENKKKEEIYLKSINWIKETYKSPDFILKMQIPNEKLRIDAVAKNLANVGNKNRIFLDISYGIEISFKDNKYKFEILYITVSNIKDLKSESFKSDISVKYWGNTPNNIEIYFNNLNQTLEKYISKKIEDEW